MLFGKFARTRTKRRRQLKLSESVSKRKLKDDISDSMWKLNKCLNQKTVFSSETLRILRKSDVGVGSRWQRRSAGSSIFRCWRVHLKHSVTCDSDQCSERTWREAQKRGVVFSVVNRYWFYDVYKPSGSSTEELLRLPKKVLPLMAKEIKSPRESKWRHCYGQSGQEKSGTSG